MKKISLLLLFAAFTINSAYSQDLIKDYKVEIGKIVQKTLGADINEFTQVPVEGKNVVRLQKEGKDIAGIHIIKGNGRFHKFYYLLIVNNDNIIQNLEIVDYPSEYGIGATSKNWLAKFKGKRAGAIEYKKDIDAVSGSTITAKSIVDGINKAAKNN